MNTIVILVAGAVFVSTAFGSDPYAEERFKAKYGRYTQAEEARREAAKNARTAAIEKGKSQAAETAICDMPNCCKREKKARKTEVSTAETYAEALFHSKYGRPSPMKNIRIAQARRQSAETLTAATAQLCTGDCCNRGE